MFSEMKAQTGNVWAFGYKNGLDFSQTPPKLISTGIEGFGYKAADHSSSISDCKGNLLFYMSPIAIFNKNHEVMTNGSINNGGGISSLNLGVLILPKPLHPSKYLAFYMFVGSNKDGLYMAKIDMNANNGLGAIVFRDSLVGNIQVPSMNLTFANHANDTDLWLITTPDEDHVVCFKITQLGLDSVPIISNSYTQISQFPANYDKSKYWEEIKTGFLRMTHDSKNLIITGIQKSNNSKAAALMYDFDRKTGKLSNEKNIFSQSELINESSTYQSEISPNDPIIYLVTSSHITEKSENIERIYQVNRFTFSKRLVASIGFKSYEWMFGIQLAPDGRIYITSSDSLYYLSYIPRPNVEKNCGFVKKWMSFSDAFGRIYSMPNNYSLGRNFSYTVNSLCIDTAVFTYEGEENFDSLSWYFGDGTQLVLKKGQYWNGMQIKHFYQVRDSVYIAKIAVPVGECGFISYWSDSVGVAPIPKYGAIDFNWQPNCFGGLLEIRDSSTSNAVKAAVFWDSESTNTAYLNAQSYFKLSKQLPNLGWHTITVKLSNDYCISQLDTFLQLDALAQVESKLYNQDRIDTFCVGMSVQLSDSFKNLQSRTINWGDKSSTSTYGLKGINQTIFKHNYSDSGLYLIKFMDTSTANCFKYDSLYAYVLPKPINNPSIKDSTFCRSFSLIINAGTQYKNEVYNWRELTQQISLGTNPILTWDKPGTIELSTTNICGTLLDTLYIKQLQKPNIELDSIYETCKLVDINLSVGLLNNEEKYLWSNTFESSQVKITKEGDYWVNAKNYCGVDSTFFKVILFAQPVPNFSTVDACEGEIIELKNNSIGATNYEWRFGDGNTSNAINPIHIYAKMGNSRTYFITLVAKISNNCQDSISKPINVNITPDARFDAAAQNKTVFFTPKNTDNQNTYKWYFGDGDSSNAKQPNHTYKADSGTYTVCFTLTNTSNCSSTQCQEVHFSVGINNLKAQGITIYPNPTYGELIIEFSSQQATSILLYNTLGQPVFEKHNLVSKQSLDISHLNKGVYWVHLVVDGAVWSRKVMVY
jgi:hypothetical protein